MTLAASATALAGVPGWSAAVTLNGMSSNGSGAGIFPGTSAPIVCPAKGDCTIAGSGGTNEGGSLSNVPYDTEEVAGRWRTAQVAVGFSGAGGAFTGVACASAGNCSAVGYSLTIVAPGSPSAAIVADEVAGRWSAVAQVPGSLLPAGATAFLNAVSCPAVGDCLAVGQYNQGEGGTTMALVVAEVHGRWRDARTWNVAESLSSQVNDLTSVACSSVGNCSAVGTTTYPGGIEQPIAALESGGVLHTAELVPGVSTIGPQGARLTLLSCTAPGSCASAGTATYNEGKGGPFESTPIVTSEVGGVWRSARRLPGLSTSLASTVTLNALGCSSNGDCDLGGSMSTGSLLALESKGLWRTPGGVPGASAFGTDPEVAQIACRIGGACYALGMADRSNQTAPFSSFTSKGSWQRAVAVPFRIDATHSAQPIGLACNSSGCTGVFEVANGTSQLTQVRTWAP